MPMASRIFESTSFSARAYFFLRRPVSGMFDLKNGEACSAAFRAQLKRARLIYGAFLTFDSMPSYIFSGIRGTEIKQDGLICVKSSTRYSVPRQ